MTKYVVIILYNKNIK